MADFPLLLLPSPKLTDRKTKSKYFPEKIHYPIHIDQCKRLSPMYKVLQKEFEACRVKLQQTAEGVEPEKCLVIETIGSIEGFIRAVEKIDGWEWMAELEDKEIEQDQVFYFLDNKNNNNKKKLPGKFYMVMTNQKGLEQLVSLWERYKENKRVTFETGLAKFKYLFKQTKDIRFWSVQDRLEENNVINSWKGEFKERGVEKVFCEIELWFRNSVKDQQELKESIMKCKGEIINECRISEIAYHSLLVKIPAENAEPLAEGRDTVLFKCEEIMFIRAAGQTTVIRELRENQFEGYEVEETDPLSGEPIVAILDGSPFSNHNWIKNRIIIDDPDNFDSDYSSETSRSHGTAISGLVIHGERELNEIPFSVPIYLRPIMVPNKQGIDPKMKIEEMPRYVLSVDLIYRAVKRIFEGDESEAAVAPSIKIINYSVGDKDRPFIRRMSPLARLLDWLSAKYGVLFVISAGNHSSEIDTKMPMIGFNKLQSLDKKEAMAVDIIYKDIRKRKLLAPAESINGITVGALNCDSSKDNTRIRNGSIDLFSDDIPSPFSAFGRGYRGAVKPDLIYNGGRIVYSEPIGTEAIFTSKDRVSDSGVIVASPGGKQGSSNEFIRDLGTSYAAALVSRIAAQCHDQLSQDKTLIAVDDKCVAPLLKAMVVHSCSWGKISERLRRILKTPYIVRQIEKGQERKKGKQINNLISSWIGYGKPCCERVLGCLKSRVTLLGFSRLGNAKSHLFELPLPSSSESLESKYRLIVTLAWLSPIAAITPRYRSAKMWFDFDKSEGSDFVPKRENIGTLEARRGTLQHEVIALGTIDKIGKEIMINVNCQEDAPGLMDSVPYGLAVTLEIANTKQVNIVDLNIYDEIRARILTPIAVQV